MVTHGNPARSNACAFCGHLPSEFTIRLGFTVDDHTAINNTIYNTNTFIQH